MASRGWFAEKMLKLRKEQTKQRRECNAISAIAEGLYEDCRYTNPRSMVSMSNRETWALQEEYRLKGESIPPMTILKMYGLV